MLLLAVVAVAVVVIVVVAVEGVGVVVAVQTYLVHVVLTPSLEPSHTCRKTRSRKRSSRCSSSGGTPRS